VCVHVGSHADLHRLEIPDDKDEIPVDLVRQLRDSLMRLPVEGRARVVILDPADRLNIQGQNSLLKTLEEPGRDTFLLLPTSRPEGLLDTVRSRVATLRVLPLDPAALRRRLADLLPGAAAARLDQAVDLAAGSVGQGLALLDEENRPILELLEGLLAGLTPEATPVTVARAALQGVVGRIPSVARATTVLWMLRTLLRKELWTALATDNTGPYAAETSVRCTQAIESLIDAESDLALRIPPEQVLTAALFRVIPHVA
jgi:hypothetical protein